MKSAAVILFFLCVHLPKDTMVSRVLIFRYLGATENRFKRCLSADKCVCLLLMPFIKPNRIVYMNRFILINLKNKTVKCVLQNNIQPDRILFLYKLAYRLYGLFVVMYIFRGCFLCLLFFLVVPIILFVTFSTLSKQAHVGI